METQIPSDSPPDEQGKTRFLPSIAILILSLLIFAALLFQYKLFYHDDAFISLRYVQNLLCGEGLVYNPGERVEGYTNFLFILLTSGAVLKGMDPVNATRIIGIAAAALLILLLSFAKTPGKRPARLAALFLASNGCFAVWALGGLETTFFALLLTLGIIPILTPVTRPLPAYLSGLSLGMAVLTRPEALLFALLALAVLLWDARQQPACRLSPVTFLAGLALFMVPWLYWKTSYYGAWLPNTFHAKGGFAFWKLLNGARYAGFTLLAFCPLALLFYPMSVLSSEKKAPYIRLSLMLISYLSYVVYVGGDHMPAFRFMVPVLPLIYLTLPDGITFLAHRAFPASALKRALLVSLVSGISVMAGLTASSCFLKRAEQRDPAAFVGEPVGRWMRSVWPREAVVALNSAGATPYFSGLKTIDMLGITDPHIALRKAPPPVLPWQKMPGHEKGDGAYVLSRKPDYIILGPTEGATEAYFLSDKEILDNPAFKAEYGYRFAWIAVNGQDAWRYPACKGSRIFFQFYERVVPDQSFDSLVPPTLQ